MRALLTALALCLVPPALAQPPAGSPTKKALKRPSRRLLDRKIAEQAGILGAMRGSGSLVSPFGSGAAASSGRAFKAADAAFARGDWAAAYRAYREAGEGRVQGRAPSLAARRYGIACQAVGELDCAQAAARRSGSVGGAGLGLGFAGDRDRDGSRLARALPTLLKLRRAAQRAEAPAAAQKLYEELLSQDPRCPDRGCPPFILREAGEAHHRAGQHGTAARLLKAYLTALPKARDRKAARRLLRAAEQAERAAVAVKGRAT